MGRKFWVIALCLWLVLWGLLSITNFRFEAENLIMGILAIAAGILLILDK